MQKCDAAVLKDHMQFICMMTGRCSPERLTVKRDSWVSRQEQQKTGREAEEIGVFTCRTTTYKLPKTDITKATVWVSECETLVAFTGSSTVKHWSLAVNFWCKLANYQRPPFKIITSRVPDVLWARPGRRYHTEENRTRGKVCWSPESVGFILWGPCMSVNIFIWQWLSYFTLNQSARQKSFTALLHPSLTLLSTLLQINSEVLISCLLTSDRLSFEQLFFICS